jgi:hypothetical protein
MVTDQAAPKHPQLALALIPVALNEIPIHMIPLYVV